jgi:hypothetical protein
MDGGEQSLVSGTKTRLRLDASGNSVRKSLAVYGLESLVIDSSHFDNA